MNATIVVVIIVALVIIALLAFMLQRQRRSQGLQQRFGPEYERVVERAGDRRSAESELSERERRRAGLDIRALPPAARDNYLQKWRATQNRFVDDPAGATAEADALVADVMRERGYPIDDFDQRATDISVDHPGVAESYREAHAISKANEQGLAGTDDLRQAFKHYRSLFAELLETESDPRKEV